MKNLKLTLRKNVTNEEFKWVKHEVKKGEEVFLHPDFARNVKNDSGIVFSFNGAEPYFELPTIALEINHDEKLYGIFMTEKGSDYASLYCKELPFDHMGLLDKIQSNRLIPVTTKQPVSKKKLIENQVLRINVKSEEIIYETIQIGDIEPLF